MIQILESGDQMLVKDLIANLQRLDENLKVELQVDAYIMDKEPSPVIGSVTSIEFNEKVVTLKAFEDLPDRNKYPAPVLNLFSQAAASL